MEHKIDSFTIFEHQNPSTDEIYEVPKRRSALRSATYLVGNMPVCQHYIGGSFAAYEFCESLWSLKKQLSRNRYLNVIIYHLQVCFTPCLPSPPFGIIRLIDGGLLIQSEKSVFVDTMHFQTPNGRAQKKKKKNVFECITFHSSMLATYIPTRFLNPVRKILLADSILTLRCTQF